MVWKAWKVAVAGLLVGCRVGGPVGTSTHAAGDASMNAEDAAAAGAATAAFQTVLLGGELELVDARWAANGDVVATTHTAVLRFAPEADAPAKLVRLPPGKIAARVAVARAADVVAIVSGDQHLLVSRDGGAFQDLARVGSPASIELSPDGRLVTLDENPSAPNTRLFGLRDASTGKLLRTFDLYAHFDPTSRYVAGRGVVAAVDGSSPDVHTEGAHFAAWVGGHAVLTRGKTLVLVEPKSGAHKTIPLCGEANVDAEGARAITVCRDRVEVIALPSGDRTPVALPPGIGARVLDVSAAREAGDELVLRYGRANAYGEVHDVKLLLVDPRARRAVNAPPIPTRELRDEPTLEPAARARPPHGRRSLQAASRWPVVVLDRAGEPIARWGPESGLAATVKVRARARGIDVTREPLPSDPSASIRSTLRLGPATDAGADEAPLPSPLPEGCVGDVRVRLEDGGVLVYPRDKQPWQAVACLCRAKTCTRAFEGDAIVADATASAIVLLASAQVRVVTPEGRARAEVGLRAGPCTHARLSLDGATVGVQCAHELLEIDVATGKESRTTPIDGAGDPGWTIEALASGSVALSPPRHRWISPSIALIAPGTGAPIGRVLLLADGAVARYADESIELFGERTAAARAVRCVEGDTLHPFERCAPQAEVRERFTLD